MLAETEAQARSLLIDALKTIGISQPEGEFTIIEVRVTTPCAIVLNDGDY